jgi:hypothetical protein
MSPIYRKPGYTAPASYTNHYTKRHREIIEQDSLRRRIPFDSQTQFYPADLFILVGFDFKGQPIWERNPRWHTEDGFYIGGSS